MNTESFPELKDMSYRMERVHQTPKIMNKNRPTPRPVAAKLHYPENQGILQSFQVTFKEQKSKWFWISQHNWK